MSIDKMLKSIPFLAHLADEQLMRLASVGRTESHSANEIIFNEGDDAKELYVILDGKVKVYKENSDGKAVMLSVLEKGNFFGEMALFDGGPRSASVSAIEPCELFSLDREGFMSFLEESPQMIPELLAGLSSKLRGVNEKFFWEMLEKQTLRAEMEKERYRSLAQMVAGVAHEINTPLGIVNTASCILIDTLSLDKLIAAADKDEELKTAFEDAREAARLIQGNLARANRLVQSFKNLSVSQITDAREMLDLPLIIEEIVSLFAPQARRANLKIEIDNRLPEKKRNWVGYQGYLSQIVLNLLSNIERYAYAESAGGRVEIALEADGEKEEPSFILTVRDFGCGISAENLSKIFEPFFTTGRGRGGTGLGMAIVSNLVADALKGTIKIESEPGKGTAVIISFPQIVPEQ